MLYLIDQDNDEAWRVYEAGQSWNQAHPKRWSISNPRANPLVRAAILHGVNHPSESQIQIIDSGEDAGILPLYHGALAAPLISADKKVFGAVELIRFGVDDENCAEEFTQEELGWFNAATSKLGHVLGEVWLREGLKQSEMKNAASVAMLEEVAAQSTVTENNVLWKNESLIEACRGAVGAKKVAVYLTHPIDEGSLTVISPDASVPTCRIETSRGLVGKVYDTGRYMNISGIHEDIHKDYDGKVDLPVAPLDAFLSVPIKSVEEEILGVIEFSGKDHGQAFSKLDRVKIESLVGRVSHALFVAQLALKCEIAEVATESLQESAALVKPQADLDLTIKTLLSKLKKRLNSEGTMLYVKEMDDDNGIEEFVKYTYDEKHGLGVHVVPIDGGAIGELLRRAHDASTRDRPTINEKDVRDQRWFSPQIDHQNTMSRTAALLLAPCKGDDGEIIGALGVLNHAEGYTNKEWSEHDMRHVESLAPLVCSWALSTRLNEARAISERKALQMVDLAANLSTCLDQPEQTRIIILDAALSIMGAEVAVLHVVSDGKLRREGWSQVPRVGCAMGYNSIVNKDMLITSTDSEHDSIESMVHTDKAMLNLIDVKSHPKFLPTMDRLTGVTSQCMLVAPLVTEDGECLGVLQLINKRPLHDEDCNESSAFSEGDCDVFEHYTVLATASIQNGERYENKAKVEDMLRVLVNDMNSMNKSLKLDTVCNKGFAACKDLVGAAKSSIYLVNPHKNETYPDATLEVEIDSMGDQAASSMRRGKQSAQRSILAEWTARNNESEMINDCEAECSKGNKLKRFDAKVDFGFNVKNIITVPLSHDDIHPLYTRSEDMKGKVSHKVFGVLQLLNKVEGDGFTQQDYFVAQKIGQYLGSALHNSLIWREKEAELHRVEGMRKMSSAMIEASSLEECMLALMRTAREATNGAYSALYFIDNEVNKVQRFDTDPEHLDQVLECSKEVVIKQSRNAIADICMFNGKSVRKAIPKGDEHIDFFGYDVRDGMPLYSYCFVPVICAADEKSAGSKRSAFDRTNAVLAIYNKNDSSLDSFDKYDEALLEGFGRDAHRCLDIHYTRFKREKKMEMDTLLIPACAEIAAAPDMAALRGAITRAVESVIPCDFRKTTSQRAKAEMSPPDRISIFLLDDESAKAGAGKKAVPELVPLLGPEGKPANFPEDESKWVADYVRQTRKPLYIPDTRLEADIENKPVWLGPNWYRVAQSAFVQTGYNTHCVIAAPITDGNGNFMGVLQACNTLYDPWEFHPGLREPDLSNLIKLIPSVATRIQQLKGSASMSYLGDLGWSGLTLEQIQGASEGVLTGGEGMID